MEILFYLLKSSLLLSLFMVGYWFLLSKETFYTFNRYFLNLGLLSSLVLPSIMFTRTVVVDPLPLAQSLMTEVSSQEILDTTGNASYELWQIALIIYSIGALCILAY
ncbi:MAG: peptidase M56, partial [Leeuwenhoekiella sp.]